MGCYLQTHSQVGMLGVFFQLWKAHFTVEDFKARCSKRITACSKWFEQRAEPAGRPARASVFSSFLKTTFAKKVLRRDSEIFFWDCQQQQQSFYIIFGKFLLQIEKRTKLLRFALKWFSSFSILILIFAPDIGSHLGR